MTFRKASDQLDFGTSIVLPHSADVAAVKFLRKLGKRVARNVAGIKEDLDESAAAAAAAPQDRIPKVQCTDCGKWRVVGSPAALAMYEHGGIFRCPEASRRCDQPCDDTADDIDVVGGRA